MRTVQRIFDLYVTQKLSVRAIARLLNSEGVAGPNGPWPYHLVHDLLENEKYVGTNVINKTVRRLGARHGANRPEDWVRAPGAFAPIVDRAIFDAAQSRRQRARRRFSDGEMLAGLVRLHRRAGRISSRLVDDCPDIPTSHHYCVRFGGLLKACAQAGVPIERRQQLAADQFATRRRPSPHNSVFGKTVEEILPLLKALLARRGALSKQIIDEEFGVGAYMAAAYRFGGGRKMYALSGYRPDPRQDRAFDLSTVEGRTASEAEALRHAASTVAIPDAVGPAALQSGGQGVLSISASPP